MLQVSLLSKILLGHKERVRGEEQARALKPAFTQRCSGKSLPAQNANIELCDFYRILLTCLDTFLVTIPLN